LRDLLLIAIVCLCSLAALRRPVVGILAFVGLSLLNPNSFTWGMGRTFPFAQLTAMGTLVGYLFWSEPKRFPKQPEFKLLLALWGMFGVSTFLAIDPEAAYQRFINVTKILLMVFLSMSLINTEERLQMLLRVIALSLGIYGLKAGFFAVLTGGNQMVWGPEHSFLEANNAIGLALDMNVPFLFYLAKNEPRRWLRRLMWAMLVFSYPAVICTFSRGAWLGLALASGMLIFKSKYRLRLTVMAVVCGVVLMPVIIQRLPERVVSRYDDLVNYEQEASAQSRFWNWTFCARVGLAYPLHGGGFNYYSPELYAIYYPEFIQHYGQGKVWSCHSIWFTVFGEHGFPGIILWFLLLGSCFYTLRHLLQLSETYEQLEWSKDCISMLQISLMIYMLVGSFYDAAYFDLFYQLVAMIIISKDLMQHTLNKIFSDENFINTKETKFTF
jgi:probable O-glycosylation ligase (exosortase A-associated)